MYPRFLWTLVWQTIPSPGERRHWMSRGTKEHDQERSRGTVEGLRVAEGRDGAAVAVGGGPRAGEPGGCTAGAEVVAQASSGRWPAGVEGEEPGGRQADAGSCQAGGDDDAGGAMGGASRTLRVRGRAEEALEPLGRVSPATNRPDPLTILGKGHRKVKAPPRHRICIDLSPGVPQTMTVASKRFGYAE